MTSGRVVRKPAPRGGGYSRVWKWDGWDNTGKMAATMIHIGLLRRYNFTLWPCTLASPLLPLPRGARDDITAATVRKRSNGLPSRLALNLRIPWKER